MPETTEDTGLYGEEQRKSDLSAVARAGHQLWVEGVGRKREVQGWQGKNRATMLLTVFGKSDILV